MTKYGYTTIAVIAILSVLLVAGSFFLKIVLLQYALWLLAALMMVFTLNFFRDPERIAPQGDKIVLSPADGTVLFVKDVEENSFIGGKAKQISIFMSPLNVHVNRIPINGTIKFARHIEGEYLVAYHDKASELNERSEIGISSQHGNVFFTQVAGYVARRIIFELTEGQKVTMGERFGMIKFGSRVDIIVPFSWIPKVEKEQTTKAGETILFEIP